MCYIVCNMRCICIFEIDFTIDALAALPNLVTVLEMVSVTSSIWAAGTNRPES